MKNYLKVTDTQIDYKNNLKINTRDISLNKKNGNFFSEQKTLIKDNLKIHLIYLVLILILKITSLKQKK